VTHSAVTRALQRGVRNALSLTPSLLAGCGGHMENACGLDSSQSTVRPCGQQSLPFHGTAADCNADTFGALSAAQCALLCQRDALRPGTRLARVKCVRPAIMVLLFAVAACSASNAKSPASTPSPESGSLNPCNGGCICFITESACNAARCPWTDGGCENGPPPVDGG